MSRNNKSEIILQPINYKLPQSIKSNTILPLQATKDTDNTTPIITQLQTIQYNDKDQSQYTQIENDKNNNLIKNNK